MQDYVGHVSDTPKKEKSKGFNKNDILKMIFPEMTQPAPLELPLTLVGNTVINEELTDTMYLTMESLRERIEVIEKRLDMLEAPIKVTLN